MVQLVQKTLAVASHTRSLKEVRDFVEESLLSARLADRARRLVIFGIDEAVTNTIAHRTHRPGEAEIVVQIDIDETRVRVLIEDRGDDGDLDSLAFPDLALRLRREGIRCVGVFVIRQVMDEVTYRFKKGFQNELELIKFTP